MSRNAAISVVRLVITMLWLWVAAAGAQPRPLSSHHVIADGHPLAVWQKSPATPSRVMVLVHGRTWSARPDFDLQVPGEEVSLMDGLVDRDVGAYAVDLRGYGDTPRDASGWLTPIRAVRDVAHVLEWVARRHPQLPKPYLFGWSYGAMVAQLTVQQRPELVSGVVLFGYPVRPGIADTPAASDGEPPAVANTAAAARSDFITPGSISPAAVDGFVRAALAADPVRADWRSLEQWKQLDARRVLVPTLLLEGALDPLALDDVHAELFTRLGTSDRTWAVIPGGDHAAFLEKPRDYFLAVLHAFVAAERDVVLDADELL